MKITGIICEYNPLHSGHIAQFRQVRQRLGADTALVCLMSGQYVQRGAPAILDKSLRAQAAVDCGADLVLEMPVPVSLSSAEGFAAGGVKILSPFCDYLSFGCENGDTESIMQTAQALLSPAFPPLLQSELKSGKSFPAARQGALAQMGGQDDLLRQPNDILAVEYGKAILSQNAGMQLLPLRRTGDYHSQTFDPLSPSATAVRHLMEEGGDWSACVPAAAREIFAGASLHTLSAGERAILGRLRAMTEEEFQQLPYGSEGLWRRLMSASRRQSSLEGIAAAVKSKRYTRTRIDRMIACAYLGISQEMLADQAPYVRVLAFSDTGRRVLKLARQSGTFLNAGEPSFSPYWALEQRWGALYGLFAQGTPDAPDMEARRRVYYRPGEYEE